MNENISVLKPDSACSFILEVPDSSPNLLRDGTFDLSKNRLNPYWEKASKGTPDFEPGSTGIYLFSGTHQNDREYIVSKLTTQITPCEKYYFSMKIKRSKSHVYAVDKIGVALVNEFAFQPNRTVIDLEPIFETESLKIIESTDQWIQICGEIITDTCANYIIIGNFRTDAETYVLPTSSLSGNSPYAHYRIDDIELYRIETIDNCMASCAPKPTMDNRLDSTDIVPIIFVSDTFLIHFETGSFKGFEIQASQVSYLEEQLALHPKLKVMIDGHADNSGDEAKNIKLSEKRAYSIYRLLIAAGIDKTRLTVKFYGSSRPIVPNNTINGKRRNRRVDVYLK